MIVSYILLPTTPLMNHKEYAPIQESSSRHIT